MSIITPQETNGYICFDEKACAAAGAALAQQYQAAGPFPHIVMDDFLPADFLRDLLAEFPERGADQDSFDRDTERYKTQFPPRQIPGRRMRNLITELNSPAILKFLEAMTGIKYLISDPYFTGGGLHETLPGGHLGVHADFNVHRLLNCERRLNLLIYLNDDWSPDYGGQLELWNKEMTRCEHRVEPLLGRAVVFNTALDSFHGHPDPLTCPPGRARRSIATYYYTAPVDGIAAMTRRTTVFRQRAGSADKPDRKVQFDHFMRDWSPPKLYPITRRLNPWGLFARDK